MPFSTRRSSCILFGAVALSGCAAANQGPAVGTWQPSAQHLPLGQSAPKSPLETVVHGFSGNPDGAFPDANLAQDKAGHIFGTTVAGGNGGGTVYELTRNGNAWSESVIHEFQSGVDGGQPYAGLVVDSSGALYGTTSNGGPNGGGTVFKLTPSGSAYALTVIHAFGTGPEGAQPLGGVVLGKKGAIFGTTASGGTSGSGTVYELVPSASGYTATSLYNFPNPAYTGFGAGNLAIDDKGTIYGTTFNGNRPGCVDCGNVFKLTPSRSGFVESDVYDFQGGSDGQNPSGGVSVDSTGAVYGTTEYGGGGPCAANPQLGQAAGCGTAYKLTPSGGAYTETILHAFQSGNDGRLPVSGLAIGHHGVLYGSTQFGGSDYDGTIFALSPSGNAYSESIVFTFTGGSTGYEPYAGVLPAKGGELFGTTVGGPANNGTCQGEPCGIVFALRP